jgi:DNA-binding LytR/AlgR family response regulator
MPSHDIVMRVLVVDDEPIARRRLLRMLERIPGAEVAGEAEDGEEALEQIRRLAPDVLLLDIQMPGLDGLSLALAGGDRFPAVVFVTAHAEYAVGAFEANAVDYLLKPVDPERLEEALARVRTRRSVDPLRIQGLAERLAATRPPPRLVAHRRGSRYFFDPLEIPRIRAEAKYSVFRSGESEYLLEESLSSLEERLDPCGFLRVHRSELVNLRFVTALHGTAGRIQLELKNGQRVSVARRRVAIVERRLGLS